MDTKGPKTAESESKENNNTRIDSMMSSVQKDNFYPHKVEKLENVPQLNLDKSPKEFTVFEPTADCECVQVAE